MKHVLTVSFALLTACASSPRPAPAPQVAPGPEQGPLETATPVSPASFSVSLPRAGVRTASATGARPEPMLPTAHTNTWGGRPPLEAQLASTRIRGLKVEDEASLRQVVDQIRVQTGLPLIVHPAAEQAVFDEGVVFDFDLEHSLSVRDALNLVTAVAGPEVRWLVRHEAVLFTTKGRARGPRKVVAYDIRRVTFARTDFIAPRIDRIRLLDEIDEDMFGGVGEHVRAIEEEDVATLVQENIAPGTWDEDGHSIELHDGFLFVVHEPEVQRAVRRFLDALDGA